MKLPEQELFLKMGQLIFFAQSTASPKYKSVSAQETWKAIPKTNLDIIFNLTIEATELKNAMFSTPV